MPCHICAGIIVHFGIAKLTVGESGKYRENRAALMLRRGVDVVNLELDEAKEPLRKFIERNPNEWYGDIGREAHG